MSIDLNTNGAKLRQTIDDLIASKISWVVLGYSGKSDALEVKETGNDDLEEMLEEFSGSSIMYGYARVTDPNTGLPKYIFINWQGSAAPDFRKLSCVNHVQDIQRFCRTIHVTINARSEDDLDLTDIMNKVAKASGSNYSVHKEKPKHVPLPTKVGSVYQKVNPTAEISVEARDAYWTKMEAEEAARKKQEASVRSAEVAKTNAATKARELLEAKARSEADASKSAAIASQKRFEASRQTSVSLDQSTADDDETDQDRRNRSEALRRERQAELAGLVQARRSSNAEENPPTKVGTVYSKIDPMAEIRSARSKQPDQDLGDSDKVGSNYKRPDPRAEIFATREKSDSPEPKPVGSTYSKVDPRADIAALRARNKNDDDTSSGRVGTTYKKVDPMAEIRAAKTSNRGDDDVPPATPSSYTKVDARTELAAISQSRRQEDEQSIQEEREKIKAEREAALERERQLIEERRASIPQQPEQPEEPSPFEPYVPEPQIDQQVNANGGAETSPTGLTAIALYDYQAGDSDELSFDPGEIISNIEMVDEGWWVGDNGRGERGLFPANYVELQQ